MPKKYKDWADIVPGAEEPGVRVSDMNPFPGAREYLGTITTSTGDQYKVYMPIVFDYATLDMSKPESMYRLAAKSIGISYLLFQTWSVLDSGQVMGKLSEALDIIGGK